MTFQLVSLRSDLRRFAIVLVPCCVGCTAIRSRSTYLGFVCSFTLCPRLMRGLTSEWPCHHSQFSRHISLFDTKFGRALTIMWTHCSRIIMSDPDGTLSHYWYLVFGQFPQAPYQYSDKLLFHLKGDRELKYQVLVPDTWY